MAEANIDLVAGREKKKRKIQNEVGKGSDKSEEAEESNRQRRIIAQRN
jgi:hypothetical protein